MLKTELDIVKYSVGYKKNSAGDVQGAQGPLIWDPSNISKTTRAKKLKLKTPLDISYCKGRDDTFKTAKITLLR